MAAISDISPLKRIFYHYFCGIATICGICTILASRGVCCDAQSPQQEKSFKLEGVEYTYIAKKFKNVTLDAARSSCSFHRSESERSLRSLSRGSHPFRSEQSYPTHFLLRCDDCKEWLDLLIIYYQVVRG